MSSNYQDQRQSNMRRLFIILGLLGLLTAFILFVVMGDYGLYNVYKLERKKARLEASITRLEKEQKELKNQIKKLKSDPEYIEKVVRNRYRMVEKGEEVFRVIKQQEADTN